jgi:radical SAM superfamily enzyme YgiQ (UPF0313 family)
MKALLIDFNHDVSSIGIRYISSYLKKNGHEVSILFLPIQMGESTRGSDRHEHVESDDEIKQIIHLIRDLNPGLIGLSMMTHFFHRAVKLTKAIKEEFKIPVIFGGVHPSISPDECIEHADLVCVGEGEETFLDLANKIEKNEPYDSLQSLWVKKDGRIIKNLVRPLTEDLDKYPFPDYELKTQYILDEGSVKKMSMDLLKKYLADYLNTKGIYRIICSRGCPFSCTYCYNSIFWNLYPNKGKYNRRRSVNNVIAELEWIKKNFDFVKLIRIVDDSFIATTEEWIRDFSRQYKEKINLPLSCLINPQTINKQKIDYLCDAGLAHVQMGIESTERVNKEVYKRNTSNEQIINVTKILSDKKDLICEYDLIVDNLYETREDLINKIKLVLEISKPYILGLYSLILYPHSPLYEKAKKDGKLDAKHTRYSKNMSSINNNYFNSLLLLSPYLPKKIAYFFLKNDDVARRVMVRSIRHAYELSLKSPLPIKNFLKWMVSW